MSGTDTGSILGAESYVGRTLLMRPQYGYGWVQQDLEGTDKYAAIEIPESFHITIDRFFSYNGSPVGGIGRVNEPGAVLDRTVVSFSCRHVGSWNFTTNVGHFNVTIGQTERVSDNGWLLAVGPPGLIGYGQLVDDAA